MAKHANLTVNDVQRRNRIAQLIADWSVSIVNPETIQDIAPLNQIKVLAYKDKQDWILKRSTISDLKRKRPKKLQSRKCGNTRNWRDL